MKNSLLQSIIIIPLIFLLCFTVSCQQQGEKAREEAAIVDIEAEKAKVQSVLNQYVKAWEIEDIELLSKIFSQDDDMVTFDGNIAKRFVGWEAWKERLQEHFESYENVDISFRDQIIKVHAASNVAWLSCILDANFLLQGQQGSLKGLRVTWVLEKRNGNWVIVQAHFSLPKAE